MFSTEPLPVSQGLCTSDRRKEGRKARKEGKVPTLVELISSLGHLRQAHSSMQPASFPEAAMASLGKLTNAFMQASQETTFTLANLNFNFALIKYDAPEEYRGLGESLSTRRKVAAEDGAIHMAARKLTALFQSVIPPVPGLIQAYGVRSSEIAALSDLNPQAASARQGVFAEHVGADGTSIWASATSGKDAVTLHLLACMLARIWTRELAIPIWTELVEQRKAILHTSMTQIDGPLQVSDLAASRIELSRRELDEWDSSARAWLQTADAGQKLRQTQFRLIIDNITMPVSTSKNVYSSIMDAWTSAMQTLESLIGGAPQRIDNGATLLGLSAWHLYPNILLAGTNRHVNQSDPLVSPGGIITVGLQNRTGDDANGVVWSLPLTQARYYGAPVMATRHAGVGESQVSFEESMLVVVGSVFSSWRLTELDVDDALDLIRIVAAAAKSFYLPTRELNTSIEEKMSNPLQNIDGHDWVEWLSVLAAAVEYYVQAAGVDKQNLARLIKYGQRNCSKFLSTPRANPAPVFSLTDFFQLLKPFKQDIESQIAFLRKWAARELDPNVATNAVIRYREARYRKYYCANIVVAVEDTPASKRRRVKSRSSGSSLSERSSDGLGLRWFASDDNDSGVREYMLSESILQPSGDPVNLPTKPGDKPIPYEFVCGNPVFAAIYIPSDLRLQCTVKENRMSAMQLYRCIKEGEFSDSHIAGALNEVAKSVSSSKTDPYFESLYATAAMSKIYARLPGARVNLQAMTPRVSKAKWWKSMRASLPNKLQAVMSCIAYFEAGGLDMNPEDLGEHVFAVCHATSIFVASRLLGDPMDDALEYSVERIIGNVGKPGLSFLITPPDPKRHHLDSSSWHLVAHERYDGKVQDSFRGTSFHLSFTGYEHPLGVGHRSGRDVPAYLLETAVSIYDKDKWVADLDILTASKRWKKLPAAESCPHPPGTQDVPPNLPLISIDTWLEILDPPQRDQHAVVRASRNPVARLATAALALQSGREVLILPDEDGGAKVCWGCHGPSLVLAAQRSDNDTGPKDNSMSDNDSFFAAWLSGDMARTKLYGESDDEEEEGGDVTWEDANHESGDSEDDSAKDGDNAEMGLFIIY